MVPQLVEVKLTWTSICPHLIKWLHHKIVILSEEKKKLVYC